MHATAPLSRHNAAETFDAPSVVVRSGGVSGELVLTKVKAALLLASVFTLSGCETMKQFEPYIGAAAGGVLAGGACNAYFKGKDKEWLATSLCAGAGILIGKLIQEKLQEQERPVLTEATYNTLQTGKKQTVVTDAGTTIITERVAPAAAAPQAPKAAEEPPKGRSRPKPTGTQKNGKKSAPPVVASPSPPPAATPPATAVAGGNCGTVKQTIVLKNKERYEDTITACEKDGVWVG